MIPHAQLAYNSAYHRAIDQTPFFVMYGRDPIQIYGALRGEFLASEEPTVETMIALKQVRAVVREKLQESSREYKEQYDRAVARFYRANAYRTDQVVWAKAETPEGEVNKLAPRYVGPFRIQYMGDRAAGLVPVAYPERPAKLVHLDKLKPCLVDDTAGIGNEEELDSPFWLDPNLELEAPEQEPPPEEAAGPSRRSKRKPRRKKQRVFSS
jgi:hypothetical protein